MQLNLKSFSQLVQDMGAALQGSASALVDVSVGSVIRAIFEANASIVLWVQWLILQVLSMTRAATSNGSDLDSWMSDFGVTRLAATPATGTVSFSRFATTLPALIPVGTTVKTSDGSLSFFVVENNTLSTWEGTLSGYVIPGGVSSTNIPVICSSAGSVGNVLSGTVTTIASSLPGVDQVINAAGFANGADQESDAALRARFFNYLASLSRATLTAVRTAITGVQQRLIFAIEENTASDGSPKPGSFLVIVDDGSGDPPSSLIASVASAIDAVRPVGTIFSVLAPVVANVNVALTIHVSVGASGLSYVSTIQQAVASYLNSLQIGWAASVTRVAQTAYLVNSSIHNVTAITLNGSASDIVPPRLAVVKAGQITVTVNVG